MKSRSVSELQNPIVTGDANFLTPSLDFAVDFGSEVPPHQETMTTVVLRDLLPTTYEDGATIASANAGEGLSAASPFALLDIQTEVEHSAVDSPLKSMAGTSPGWGSINVIPTAIHETSAGLHIAPPVDSDFTTDALFEPASALTPITSINLANLTPMPFEGHGVEAVANNSDDTALAHPAAQSSLDTGSESGAGALAYLENSSGGSPVTNTGVGSGGATASQVQAALDESGLSVNGSGIKIGVLSDSFNDLGGATADEADGALPSSVQVLKDLSSGGTDEGRAMMEIIHEIAPGASLAFYTADGGEQDFANGIIALANAGAKVIVDDVGYFDEPYFQNGVVAQAIQTVEAEGVTYVTAAGNEASNGYQASFTAASGTFDGVALSNAENFGGSLTQTITINTEGTGDDVPLTLEWNQAYGAVSSSTADLELLVFHNGALMATATNVNNQFTDEAGNPWTAYDFSSSGTYQIAIENISSSSTDAGLIFKEITWGDGLPATISGANTGTVVGHSMTPGAITAGAVYVGQTPDFGSNPAISESFSSSGAGTELLFANNGAALSSPDLLNPVVVSGVDGINTTVPGGLSDFFGTSASSASLAGVAALLLSANPNLTPADIEAILEQTAASMGNTAVAGAGLAQIDPAVALATQHFAIVGAAPSPALQSGSAVAVTGARPIVNDSAVNLTSATIRITNSSGIALAGDKLFAGGVESGTTNGLSVSWNATTDTLTLSGAGAVAQYGFVLNEITFQDSGTDTSSGSHPVRDLTWTINDGTNTYTTTSTIQTDRAPVLVNTAAVDATGATVTATTTNGVLSNASDLDGDSLTVIAISDTSHGAGIISSSLAGTYGHLTLNANGSYSYVADNTTAISGGPTGSHLQDVFSYTVSDGHGGTTNASLTITLDRAPIVSSANVLLGAGQTSIAASSLFSAIDPDGNSIATYAFEDTGPGHFVLNGVAQTNNQVITVSAAQLSQLSLVSVPGAAADTVQVSVNDGTLSSNPSSFTVVAPELIATDGATSLIQANNDYFLDPAGGNGTSPEITQAGAAVTPGTFKAIGAVQLSGGGYDVAWQMVGSSVFTVWSVDSHGNFVANIGNDLSGTSSALENFETIFGQDLNGDGTIGPPPPPPLTTIQVDGTTTLVQSGNNYFLDVTGSNTLGPEVTQAGVAATPGVYAAVDAVKLSGGGYDFAWKMVGSETFTIWSLDSNGNFIANIGNNLAGNSTALENFETIFGQDLNGDGTIGPPPPPPPTTIQVDGTTTLVQSGNNYFLDVTGSNTLGPEVTQGGVAATPGLYAAVDAVKLSGGGYDLAWKLVGSETFTIWSLDSNGNFIANIGNNLAGISNALENFETIFGQDLNGDNTIGPPPPPPPTTIQTDGTTTLVQSGNNYFLDVTGSNTLGPEITQGGVAATPGVFTAIGGVHVTGGGYDVAWKMAGSETFTIWSLDSNGNFIANIGNDLAGNSTALENFETIFGQDLNGDNTIGPPPPPPPTTIKTDGTTTLVQSGNNYFLDVTGSNTLGPEITQGGVAATPGVFTAIGAVHVTGGGYDVAWKMADSSIFTIWSVDSNGNFIANIGNDLPGNSTALENFETIFGQDLNGNGTIGSSTHAAATDVASNGNGIAITNSTKHLSDDNFHFGNEGFRFGGDNNGVTGQTPAAAMAAHDSFVFTDSSGSSSPANFAPTANNVLFNVPTFTDSHPAPAGTHEEALGSAATHDAAHALQWLAHHGDFHFV